MLQPVYCSLCGSKLAIKSCVNDDRKRPCCSSCDYIVYHNPKPTVKALIFKESKFLMVRRAEEPHIGGWDLPGGYVEWDEHPEEGALRETREETGVIAEIDSLIGAFHKVWNPQNKDSSILNLAYRCRWLEGEPQVMSPHEIDQVQWVDMNNLPGWVAYGHYDEVMRLLESER